MTTCIVERDGKPDLKFEGQWIAEASSHTSRGESENRWTELDLWKTKSGKFVVRIKGVTIWQGEHDRHAAYVCNDEQAVVTALIEHNHGELSWLAKELLGKAGIDSAEEIV